MALELNPAKIAAELKTNPAWQQRTSGKKWVCPYDGSLGPLWLDDSQAMAAAIVQFFTGEYTGPSDDTAAVMSLPKVIEAQITHDVKDRLRKDDAWRLKNRDNKWLNPYTGHVTEIELRDDVPLTKAKYQEIVAHLLKTPQFQNNKGTPLDFPYLKARQQFLDSPACKVFGPQNHWICPYCVKETDFVKTSASTDEDVFAGAWKHLSLCRAFNNGKGQPRPLSELTASLKQGERLNKLAAAAAQRFQNDDRFKRFSLEGMWECPFCGNGLGNIKPTWENATVARMSSIAMAKHWLYACQPFQNQIANLDHDDQVVAKLDAAPKAAVVTPMTAGDDPFATFVIHAKENKTEEQAQALPSQVMMSMGGGMSALMDRKAFAKALEADKQFTEAKELLKMLPPPPKTDAMECAVVFRPCDVVDMVGGDFYDFIDLPNGGLGLAQGDVTGHGLEVWGEMTTAMRNIRLYAKRCPPRETLVRTNDELVADLIGKTFVTAMYAMIDRQTYQLRLSRAGHNPAIVFNPRRKPHSLIQLDPRGMVLGMAKRAIFENALEEVSFQLYSGDTVVIYTDGANETMNADGEEFGIERICRVIEKHGASPPDVMLAGVMQALDEFRGARDPDDDVTFIAVKIH